MAFPWHFSIRTKVLFVLLSVVVPSIALYLFLASRISVQDKTLLLYELNQTEVRTLGVGAEARVSRVLERLRLVLTSPDSAMRWLGDLEGDPEILRITKVNLDKKGATQLVGVKREPWLSYGIGSIETRLLYDQIDARKPVQWRDIEAGQAWIVGVPLTRNKANPAKLGQQNDDVPPVYRVAIRLRGQAAVADVRAEPLLQGFLRPGTAELALVGSDQELLAGSLKVEGNALYQAALQSKVRSEVRTFDADGESYLGSFYRLNFGDLVMLARSRTSEAYQAAWILIRKTVLYAFVIISAAFLVALFFSHQLTQPIMRLVAATKLLAQGDFSAAVSVPDLKQVGGGDGSDEITVLARSFNTMTQDIRRSREQIEEYSRDLEKKVADRTAAIREAQEALLRTTRLASVGEVAGRAAHEVLNPLTAIMTRTEKVKDQVIPASEKDVSLLKEIIGAWKADYTKGGITALGDALSKPSQALPGKTLVEEDLSNLGAIGLDTEKFMGSLKKDLDFILGEANRIAKIVNGMRSLTRVSGSKKEIVLVDVVKEALSSIGDVLMKAGITSAIDAKGFEKGTVLFDRDELIQVLLNLFRNSMQAMLESARRGEAMGLGRIDVRITRRDDVFELRISDNGPGISSEHAHKVFDASFTTKGADEGTGLGLSIARRFARAYDGDLILEKSVAFEQTTFLMTLPIGAGTT